MFQRFGIGILTLSGSLFTACNQKVEEPVPVPAPVASASSSPQSPGLLDRYEHEKKACLKALGIIGRTNVSSCDFAARVELAEQNRDPSGRGSLYREAQTRLAQHYDQFLSLETPGQRLAFQDSILMNNLDLALVSGRFGPPLSESQIEEILEGVRQKNGRTHLRPPRPRPLSMRELAYPSSSLEIRVEELPVELKKRASRIHFSKEAAEQLGLEAGKDTLWNFLAQNLDLIFIASPEKEFPDPNLYGQMYSPFFKAVMINLEKLKGVFGDDVLFGALATLSHETYHVFYHRKLARKDGRLVGAVTLDERNGHLMSAYVLKELIGQVKKEGTRRTSSNVVSMMASYFLATYGANIALGFTDHDESFRFDLPPNFRREMLKRHPNDFARIYLRKRGVTLEAYLEKVFRTL